MCEKMKEINLSQFQITLDGYKDKHNKIRYEDKSEGSYDRIINSINSVCSIIPNAHITLRINYTNSTIEGVNKIVDDIHVESRSKVTVVFQRVWQTKDKETPDESALAVEIDQIQQKGIHVSKDSFSYQKGCLCYADSVYQSVVNFDGTLYKCTARDFVNKDYSVGYINSDGYPVWNDNYYKYFLKSPLQNKKCIKCRYAPICLGVCCQKFVEEGDLFVNKHCDKKNILNSLNAELLENLYDYLKERCVVK